MKELRKYVITMQEDGEITLPKAVLQHMGIPNGGLVKITTIKQKGEVAGLRIRKAEPPKVKTQSKKEGREGIE